MSVGGRPNETNDLTYRAKGVQTMISSSLQSLRRYAGCVWEKEGSCWRGKPAWSEWEDMYEVGRRMNANKNRAHGAPNAADVPQEVLLCLVERVVERVKHVAVVGGLDTN